MNLESLLDFGGHPPSQYILNLFQYVIFNSRTYTKTAELMDWFLKGDIKVTRGWSFF